MADQHVTWDVFNERRKSIDGRFKEVERRMEEIEHRLNWLIGLALLGVGMLALNLFLQVSK